MTGAAVVGTGFGCYTHVRALRAADQHQFPSSKPRFVERSNQVMLALFRNQPADLNNVALRGEAVTTYEGMLGRAL